MTIKRLWHSFIMNTKRNGNAKVAYLRKHNLFRHIGEGVYFQGRILPLYAELISIGDNVKIASKVTFITHSIIHQMINASQDISVLTKMQEQVGCIEIGNNVFIGAGTTILPNVRIGSNVIVAAGSVVTKDIPSNSVYGGVPARFIESMDDYLKKMTEKTRYPDNLIPRKQEITHELADYLWQEFYSKRINQ